MRASARAIGRHPNSAWRRRRECPGFARRFEAALEDAETRLEHALIDYANTLIDRAAAAVEAPPADAAADRSDTITPVEASFALQVLKWLDARKAGTQRGARRYAPKEPPIEEVRASIVRKLDAIERHQAKYGPPEAGDGGGTGDGRE